MYKVLADTSNHKLILIAFKDNKQIYTKIIDDIILQTELFPQEFDKMLENLKIEVANIQQFYVTLGPGSFTGSKVALTFFKTICIILKAQLFVLNSLHFIAGPFYSGEIKIDARSKQCYYGKYLNGQEVIQPEIKIEATKSTFWDLQNLKENAVDYLPLFKLANPLTIEPIYLKKLPYVKKRENL